MLSFSQRALASYTIENLMPWYENDGNGNFVLREVLSSYYNGNPKTVHVADLDSDGDIDILSTYVGQSDGRISWLENDGSGNFNSRLLSSGGLQYPRAVYAADLDNDGDMDVLSTSDGDYKIAWYENDGSGNFGTQQLISNNVVSARAISAADLDNDGDIDVLSASYGDDKIAWYKNDGNGNFGSQQLITFSLASGIRHRICRRLGQRW
ncbi:MAG: VCBS repeat-containing protein [Sphingobacteriales bacterium]|nr:VCBS repeat-containing protein [Sphingobacteriales bacterium]